MQAQFEGSMFKRICIVGTGAVGCSVALLARAKGLAGEIVGTDRVAAHLEMARQLGFIDRGVAEPARGVMGADAVVLAVPLDEMFIVLGKIGADIRPQSMITCTAGTTLRVWSQVVGEVPAVAHFVPSFPLVYSSSCGPGGAAASLLQGHRCLVARHDSYQPDALERVATFWDSLGMQAEILDGEQFEWAVAGGHLWPHLLISSIDRVAKEHFSIGPETALGRWLGSTESQRDRTRSVQLYAPKLCRLLDRLRDDLGKVRRGLGGKPEEEEEKRG